MISGRKRTPQMVVDEVLLLVDTYFQLKATYDRSEKNQLVSELSQHLRSFPFFPEWNLNPVFRSVAGMQMCLANVESIDPTRSSSFDHNSALQRKIYSYYVDRQKELRLLAKAIISVSTIRFPIDYSFANSEIGMLVPSYHIFTERTDKKIATLYRELLLTGKTVCCLCQRDLNEDYTCGEKLLEIHIGKPIHENKDGMRITISDLVGICPTCHKLAHSSYETYELERLQMLLRKRGSNNVQL